MTNELDVQGHLVDAGNDLGGHCFKCNNRFLKGVVDLSMKVLGFPHTYIEVKFVKHWSKRLGRDDISAEDLKRLDNVPQVRIELTPHQREFLRAQRLAGGEVGWVMVVDEGRGNFAMTCGFHVPSHGVLYYDDKNWLRKLRGGTWPIESILTRLQRQAR